MGSFLHRYQILLGIILGALIIGFFIYLGIANNRNGGQSVNSIQSATSTEQPTSAANPIQAVPEQETQQPVQPQPTWHTVTSFSGVGQMNTAPFHITGDKWRVVWSCDTTVTADQFGLDVMAYSTNGNDPGSTVVKTTCPYSGANNYQPAPGFGPPGDFYLSIIADNINTQEYTNWKVTIQDFY